ncbi:hypothetical protein IC575_002205 [Cucumis melo]
MISRITIISIWLQRSLKKTILTRADLGLPDAYINGDFSFVDKDEDLLIFFLVSFFFQLKIFNPYLARLYHSNFFCRLLLLEKI